MRNTIKTYFKDNQKIYVENIIEFVRNTEYEFDFELRQNIDNFVYLIEPLVNIAINGITMKVICNDDSISINKTYNQQELNKLLVELNDQALFIKNFFKKIIPKINVKKSIQP